VLQCDVVCYSLLQCVTIASGANYVNLDTCSVYVCVCVDVKSILFVGACKGVF